MSKASEDKIIISPDVQEVLEQILSRFEDQLNEISDKLDDIRSRIPGARHG